MGLGVGVGLDILRQAFCSGLVISSAFLLDIGDNLILEERKEEIPRRDKVSRLGRYLPRYGTEEGLLKGAQDYGNVTRC